MTMPWKPTNAMREVELRTDYIERTMAEHRPIDNGTLAHLMQAVEDYKARIAEMEAIVGELTDTYEARKRSDRAFLEAARQSKERPHNDPTP